MEIRRYEPRDLEQIAHLFYVTVHTINAKDYTDEQLNVWATGNIDWDKWNDSFQSHITYVVSEGDLIIGFGDIDHTGYLDRLYVHKDYQYKGVATTICDRLECETGARIILTHASITAKPFFEKRGYKVIKRQEVERQGVFLTNYVMQKDL